MKRTAPVMFCIAMFIIACEKQELNSAQSSSAATIAKKQELQIVFFTKGARDFTGTDVSFVSNGEVFDRGDKIFDDCDYMNSNHSSGEVKVQANPYSSNEDWIITIMEQRSGATFSVGEHYYWVQDLYSSPTPPYRILVADFDNRDNSSIPYIKIGPFSDTTYRGTGSWNIALSSHPSVKNGGGKLIYNGSIKYDFPAIYYAAGETDGTLNDIGKRISEVSTLTGTYK